MRLSPRSNLALAALALALLSGCADYLTRRDSVTLRAGNASEANTLIMTAAPWPENVNDTTITFPK